MVERAVSIAYTHIYAPLRNDVFFSLEELNHAMLQKLYDLNNKPYRNDAYSRMYLYEQHEQQTLKTLPAEILFIKNV